MIRVVFWLIIVDIEEPKIKQSCLFIASLLGEKNHMGKTQKKKN